jgi:hypothetical protein
MATVTITRNNLFVHQLSKGSASTPAIYIAESIGWTNEDLTKAALALLEFHVDKQWHNADAMAMLYAFVKHDTRSTKTIGFTSSGETLPILENKSKTDALIAAAAKNEVTATFTVNANGTLSETAIASALNVARLGKFFQS